MMYILHNLITKQQFPLGDSRDMAAVVKALENAIPHRLFQDPDKFQVLLDDYNLTGKDILIGRIFGSDGIYYERSLRQWLVTDETGRHIAPDTLKEWAARFRPAKVYYEWGGVWTGSRPHGHRVNWPSMVMSDLRARDRLIYGDREDLLELAGSAACSRLSDRPDAKLVRKTTMYAAERQFGAISHCWKDQHRCQRSWQKHKKCKRLAA